MMEVVSGDNSSYKTDVQSSRQIVTTSKPTPNVLPPMHNALCVEYGKLYLYLTLAANS